MSLSPQQARRLAEEMLSGPDSEARQGPDGPFPGRGAEDVAPQEIAGYRIVGVIGTGGMGTVYEAEQLNPRRRVALKVLRRGLASRSALRRFDHEARILAGLRHPGIAQVYEAGTWDDGTGDVPYFAMELVAGARPLCAFAAAEGLGIRQRLELFARVCEAVHHGHQRGIVHRDLKPANILVDEEGHPKIIDFGVARVTDSDIAVTTLQTIRGEIIGTLHYMIPEQCDGNSLEIDTRSDVYSLGVILYELLCGRLPYDLTRTSIPAATRIIQDRPPPSPSESHRSLRGDLDAVVLKSLAKDRTDRYQSAAELALDIRRHLAGEPVEARRPTPWTRLVRWVGRHPIVSTSAACAALVTVSVVTAMTAVWILLRQPGSVHLARDGREARVVSVGGAVLRSWQTQTERGITSGDLVDVPSEWGGGALAVIGFGPAPDLEYAGRLCAFRAGDREGPPIWHSSVAAGDLAGSFVRRGTDTAGFSVRSAAVADVFPRSPGDEVIAVFTHSPSSAASIRVLDLRGRVLYEVWHDGTIAQIVWVPAWQCIVARAWNSEAFWSERGHANPKHNRYPHVLFALEPRLGHKARDVVSPGRPASMATVRWYRCLLPPEALDVYGGIEITSPDLGAPAGTLKVALRRRDDPSARLSWLIDRGGREVPGTRGANDGHKLDPDSPPVDLVYLGELPGRRSGP